MRIRLLFLGLLALPNLLPALAAAQVRSASPVLREPLDWGPDAAWRRLARDVSQRRLALLRSGNIAALNADRPGPGPFRLQSLISGGAASVSVHGTFHVPVIAVAYKNIDVAYPIVDYQQLLFTQAPTDRPYSISTFYEEMSHHRIAMDGVVFPTVRVDSNAAFYTDGCNGITVSGTTSCPGRALNRMAVMLVAALDSISNGPDSTVVWSQFDNDGPDGIPNSGDDDGLVDFVAFLQPEVGGECRSNFPVPTGVWSHRFRISGWTGQQYTTKTPRRGANGLPIPGQFLHVDSYTIQSQLGGTTACDGSSIMAIGTLAHETGHAFGLPDLYDVTNNTQGIGGWGLMGSGNYARPYSPSSYDAWSLNQLGWATIDTLGTSRTVLAGARLLSDTVFYARSDNPNEFVLLENRAAVLSDTAQMNPALPPTCPMNGFCAKSPGLLLWLIDQPKVDLGLPGNGVNVGAVQGVEVIEADGLGQLRAAGSRNRGDRGDSYPGSSNNTHFGLLTTPSARDNFGAYLGFTLDSIQQLANNVMRFRFTRRAASVIQALNGAQIRVNGDLWGKFEEVVPGGDQLQVSADDPQLIAGGKSRARFLAWSNGGARAQSLISNPAKPDTLSASFSLEHRILLNTTGGGTVASSVAGDLGGGVYLNDGAQVTLTASTPAGTIFAGWRGDTVSVNPVMNLTLHHGYDLEARFVQILAVPAADAAEDLLGNFKLTNAQRAYLDELGNGNGSFDVGDLLAMYRRAGLAVPQAVLQAASRSVPPSRKVKP